MAKSYNLWLMLRIEQTQQPRVVCLNAIRPTAANKLDGQAIHALAGHGLEFDRSIRTGVHNSAVLLSRAEEQRASLSEYRRDLDMLPSASWRKAATKLRIPHRRYQQIRDFIFEGTPFFEPGD